MPFPKVVENSHYHLWTDALHARALAKQANNRWDRGTYVRWTVITAWTVLEMACEAALETSGIGRSFKQNLDAGCAAKRVHLIDWGSGVWQRVTAVHGTRKDFVHLNVAHEKLFPGFEEADRAITIIRDGVTDIYNRVGKPPPDWLQDDDDKGWDRVLGTMSHGQAIHGGVDAKGDDTVRTSYEYKDREYDYEFCPVHLEPTPTRSSSVYTKTFGFL